MNTLEKLLPRNGNILFACIGTDRSTGDSLGPLVGTMLEEKGYTVIGTLDYPLHALNLADRVEEAKKDYPHHFIIAIDACLGKMEDIGKVIIEEGAIKPGLAVKKKLPHVGDVAIKGIVNVGGYMEYSVLQNTRLGLVWNMAREVVEICDNALKVRQVNNWTLNQEEAMMLLNTKPVELVTSTTARDIDLPKESRLANARKILTIRNGKPREWIKEVLGTWVEEE